MYFVKDPVTAGQYNVSVAIDDVVQPETESLLFDNTGVLDATSATALNLASYAPANANAQPINVDFSNITGYGATFCNLRNFSGWLWRWIACWI